MNTRHTLVTGVAASLLLMLSCGGSGGSDDSPAFQPAENPNALPITADNAQFIVTAVLDGVVSTINLVDLLDVVVLPAGRIAGDYSRSTLQDSSVQAVFVQTVACDSGEVTVEWNDADDSLAISTGDTMDMLFAECFFQDVATTLDGIMSMTDIEIVGEPFFQISPWSFAATFGFVDLSGTDSDGEAIINGSLGVDMTSADNVVIESTVTSDMLSVLFAGINESISEFVARQVTDLSTLTQTTRADGRYSSDILGGSVRFETLGAFVIFGSDEPSSGQMLIADPTSSVLVTVLDNINVQLDIDLDRDGSIDHTLVVPWSELDIG